MKNKIADNCTATIDAVVFGVRMSLPITKEIVFPTLLEEIPEGAREGNDATHIGIGLRQYNVWKHNRLIGYSVYSNGMGTTPQGFVHYEPLDEPIAPRELVCQCCNQPFEEEDLQMRVEEFYRWEQLKPDYCPHCDVAL